MRGAPPEQARAAVAEIIAVGWEQLPAHERDTVLDVWLAEWMIATDNPDPQPTAIHSYRSPGVFHGQSGLTYKERDELLAHRAVCEETATEARGLAHALRLRAAVEEFDRKIVYTPSRPDRGAEVDDIQRRREALSESLTRCLAQPEVKAAALLVWSAFGYSFEENDDLAWNDLRARDPVYLDALSVRLSLLGRHLADRAELADDVPSKPRAGKKRNAATRALLERLESVPGADLAALKRHVATRAVETWNRRITGGPVLPRNSTTAATLSEERTRSIKAHAIDNWLEHLRTMQNKAR